MSKYIRLSKTQNTIVKSAGFVTVNGRTVVRTAYVKGENYKTRNRLFELGLIDSTNQNAALTELGVSAWVTLNDPQSTGKVLTGEPCRVAAEVKDPRTEQPHAVQDELPRVGDYLDGLSNALDARGQRHAKLVAAWPSGTRVSGPDSRGVMRTGTVHGGDHGEVADRTHHNHGRTYVGVWWDESSDSTIPRSRPFTDELTKI